MRGGAAKSMGAEERGGRAPDRGVESGAGMEREGGGQAPKDQEPDCARARETGRDGLRPVAPRRPHPALEDEVPQELKIEIRKPGDERDTRSRRRSFATRGTFLLADVRVARMGGTGGTARVLTNPLRDGASAVRQESLNQRGLLCAHGTGARRAFSRFPCFAPEPPALPSHCGPRAEPTTLEPGMRRSAGTG